MNIVNLTPHKINILRNGLACPESVIEIEPSGTVARLEVTRQEVSNIPEANGEIIDPKDGLGGIAQYHSVFGAPSGLPSPEENTIYIVSSLFRSGFDRPDLWVPGELVRDAEGRPIGCLGLSR